MSLIDIGKLLESVADFEVGTHVEVEVCLRTSGRIKLRITGEDAVTRTHGFKDIYAAIRWLDH